MADCRYCGLKIADIELWQIADGEWQMADGGWQMADGGWQIEDMADCIFQI